MKSNKKAQITLVLCWFLLSFNMLFALILLLNDLEVVTWGEVKPLYYFNCIFGSFVMIFCIIRDKAKKHDGGEKP